MIFLGPSLSQEKARRILPDADYRPPAKKGDFLRLFTNSDVKTVGFVDGVFLQDYPPTPIEVCQLARKEDVLVAGAASLGALRAVELEKFGMVGIGKIFQLYKSGRINADDEVAVTFVPNEEYRLQSEAMIDIRYNLFLAHKKGVISRQAKRIFTKIAKDIYFPYRTYSNMLDEAKIKHPELAEQAESFQNYILSNRRSLKELDALRLLRYLKDSSLQRM